jgi:hypothetical protein
MVLGASAAIGSLVYELQRSGLLVPHSLERAVQAHLDALGIAAFALAFTGSLLGAYLSRGGGRPTRVLLWGTVLSVAALVAQLLLPL